MHVNCGEEENSTTRVFLFFLFFLMQLCSYFIQCVVFNPTAVQCTFLIPLMIADQQGNNVGRVEQV